MMRAGERAARGLQQSHLAALRGPCGSCMGATADQGSTKRGCKKQSRCSRPSVLAQHDALAGHPRRREPAREVRGCLALEAAHEHLQGGQSSRKSSVGTVIGVVR